MKTTTFKPDKFLCPTHRKQEISSETLQDFKQKLNTFLGNIHEPSCEGKQETDLRDFLNDALYKGKFYINKKETIDWAIHNGMDAKSKVAVLIEVKKTAEKTDMFTEAKPNVKGFHELVLYYLREHIDNKNHEIKYLIATNCHEWYIFNELWFIENIFFSVSHQLQIKSQKISENLNNTKLIKTANSNRKLKIVGNFKEVL